MRATKSICVLSLLPLMLAAPALGEVQIETVFVGDPDNADDFRFDPMGFGGVDHTYRIGKYEVTNGQYRAFLNAKATVGDPYSLYNTPMSGPRGGIDQTGSGTPEDPWFYSAKGGDSDWDNRAVNYVSFWDSARFANWLHNGHGDGDTESGAYLNIGDELTFARQPGARFFLPTEDEWYKAAFFDPSKDGDPGYWTYPTRSDGRPSNDAPPGSDLVNGSANYGTGLLALVGSYTAKPSTSYYGTFDQGGSIWEWNETIIYDLYYGLRGGSFNDFYGMDAGHRDSYPAYFENPNMGFRLAAAVPEPAGLALVLAGFLAVLGGRACRRRHAPHL